MPQASVSRAEGREQGRRTRDSRSVSPDVGEWRPWKTGEAGREFLLAWEFAKLVSFSSSPVGWVQWDIGWCLI